MRRIIGAAIAAAALFGAATAGAQPATPGVDQRRQVTVSIADLDTATAAGASALSGRMRAAAKAVCGPAPQSRLDLQRVQDFNECVRESLAEASARLSRPNAAYADARGPR